MEGYAPNDPVTTCDPTEKPGVQRFRDWVLENFGGDDLGIVRQCQAGDGQTSKHTEGRAWDWSPPSSTCFERLWELLAASGDELLRRAGVRVVIYRRRIWVADGAGWRPYTGPDAHTTHVHFDFSRAGAHGELSFLRDPPTLGQIGKAPTKVQPHAWTCELPATKTPFSDPKAGLVRELARGYEDVFGQKPMATTVAVAWAQVSLETGRTQNMYNYNFANITPGRSWTGCVHKLILPASEPPYYRAYGSAEEGAKNYWSVLAGRYATALVAFRDGDPQRAALELKKKGFYTADEQKYARAMASLYRELMGTAPAWKSMLIGMALVGASWMAERHG